MPQQNNRECGSRKEQAAREFLEKNHIMIREQNFRCRTGEIDLIGLDGSTLVFFEVKYRKNTKTGSPSEAVGIRKQQTICHVSDYYRMMRNIPEECAVRFDVICILKDETEWIKDAFPYQRGYGYR